MTPQKIITEQLLSLASGIRYVKKQTGSTHPAIQIIELFNRNHLVPRGAFRLYLSALPQRTSPLSIQLFSDYFYGRRSVPIWITTSVIDVSLAFIEETASLPSSISAEVRLHALSALKVFVGGESQLKWVLSTHERLITTGDFIKD